MKLSFLPALTIPLALIHSGYGQVVSPSANVTNVAIDLLDGSRAFARLVRTNA